MYQNSIGIDIGKENFTVAIHDQKETNTFSNTPKGFNQFFKTHKDILAQSLVVIETTGGYEMEVIRYLQAKNVSIHRANTRKVKHYIRSFGILGKSDAIDARALAKYGTDRQKSLDLFQEASNKELQKLVERRFDLKQMLTQEKNRLKAPDQDVLIKSFEAIIKALEQQLAIVDSEIESYCQRQPLIQQERKVLETIEGIGKIISVQLLALLPELGSLNRKQIASLAGLAPHPYESGKKKGYRLVRGGRKSVKEVLFMAALTASRSKSQLGDFYKKLIESGKKKMVAIGALMRKIVVIANARLRDSRSCILNYQHS